MTRLAVITGSVRPNRVGSAVAQWVAEKASTVEGVEAEVLELADFRLPVFAEEVPPMMAAPRDPASTPSTVRAFSATHWATAEPTRLGRTEPVMTARRVMRNLHRVGAGPVARPAPGH